MVYLYSLENLSNIYNPVGCYFIANGKVYQIKHEICKTHADELRREQVIEKSDMQYILTLRGTSHYICERVLNI